MHAYLRKLVDERNALTGLMQTTTDRAVAEDRELTETESERMRGWQERAAQLDHDCAEQNEYLSTQRAWAKLQDQLTANADDPASSTGGGVALATRSGDADASASWGEAFVRSSAFGAYSGHGSSGRVEVGELWTRAPIQSGFVPYPPTRLAAPEPTFLTPLLDAISHERVSTNAVEWIGYGRTADAAVVAEGALKPEAELAITQAAAALETVAHWKAITRQALEDLPRIQSIVENALRRGVLSKLESMAVASLVAADIPEAEGADLIGGIRQGIATVQTAGYATPNVAVINPADFASIDLATWGAGNAAAPSLNSTLWGLRLIALPSVPVGQAFVGDFKAALTMFERGTAQVYLTDSHADFFLRNQLVILAETRAHTAVVSPNAVVHVTAAPAEIDGGGTARAAK